MKSYLYSLATDARNDFASQAVKAVLRVLSWIYGLAVTGVRQGYAWGLLPKKALPRPVISVGNITLGGSGKTPLTEYVVRVCQDKGAWPAVLTRGYSLKADIQDEARLLSKNLNDTPVIVGADRFSAGSAALQSERIDLFVMDDGFQHFRLKRDLDIVAIDATNPFGNGCVIPRGILREPLGALCHADIFVLTRVNEALPGAVENLRQRLSRFDPAALVVEAVHEPFRLAEIRSAEERPLSFLSGKDVYAFCGIANPRGFLSTLRALDAQVRGERLFEDHHVYAQSEAEEINDTCRKRGHRIVVTTEKDAVKLNQYAHCFDEGTAVLSLGIRIKIFKGEDELHERIHRLLAD